MRLTRKARLGYEDFLYVSQQARKKLGLRRGRKERCLPQLLPEAALRSAGMYSTRSAELAGRRQSHD